MTLLFDWLTSSTAESLCLTLLHTLWQGAAWGVLLLVLLRCIPNSRPRARYVVSLACLYGLLGGACLSWSILRQPGPPAYDGEPIVVAAVEIEQSEAVERATPVSGPMTEPPTWTLELADFVPWVVAAWIVGASVCLTLSSRSIAAVRRFRLGKPIEDTGVLRLFERLITDFRLSRSIRLLCVDGLTQPGVVGVLKPVVLIPASLVTGLSPGEWEAVLAHELAHIRRWDYLVNLSQMVIESLLFFHPVVWWLSRQVSLEREACCDASAVRLTSRPVQYATLLVDLAERFQSSTSTAAVAFSRAGSGSLMERVRRIVTPGCRSELAIRRPMAISFVVLSLLAVTLLQAGTDMAVAVTAEILSDEQRVETLVESAREIAVPGTTFGLGVEEGKLTIRGVIEFEGGQAPEKPVSVHEHTRRGNNSRGITHGYVDLAKTSEFEVVVQPGINWLEFGHPDFAETTVGPYGPDDRPLVSGVRVVLKRGIDIPVVVTADGEPVPEALLLRYSGVTGTGRADRPTTDANGRTVLEHIDPELEYGFWVTAPGCQEMHAPKRKFTAGSTLRLEILRAKPATGVIVNRQGDPIADAKVRQLRKRRPGSTSLGRRGPMAVSDDAGHFQLGELEDGSTYDLMVEADGYAPTIIPNVQPGDKDIRAELAPALTVKGTVVGPIEQLEDVQTKRSIQWRLRFPRLPGDFSERLPIQKQLTFEIVDGVGKFTLPPMAPGELLLWVGESSLKRELTESIDDLRIVLSDEGKLVSPGSSAKRPIRIRFTRDGKKVSPRGVLGIVGRASEPNARQQQLCPIENGLVEARVHSPDMLNFDGAKMIGFWFRDDFNSPVEVTSGEGTLEIAIPVLPAGAAKGVVLDADGSPVVGANASVRYRLDYRTSTGPSGYTRSFNSQTNDKGEFFASPIPFGAKCSVIVSSDKHIVIGEEFTVSAKNALPSCAIQLGPSVDARVRLLDPSGAPMVGQSVWWWFEHPLKSGGSWGPPEITDSQGECVISGLNPDLRGHYTARLGFTKDYIPTSNVPLKLNGETTVVQVQRGAVIFGALLDAQGNPMPGVELQAESINWKPGGDSFSSYKPEGLTDSAGKFRFSNLPLGKLRIRHPQSTFMEATAVPAGKAKPITFRMAR